MNILPKGAVPVVMASMVASFLILYFGNAVADNGDKKAEEMALKVKTKVIEAKERATLEASSPAITVTSPPPPGPFVSEKQIKNTRGQLVSLTTNKVVISKLKKLEQVKPVALEDIEFKRMQPSMPALSAPPVEPKLDTVKSKLPEKSLILKEPKLIKAEPIAPVTPKKVVGITLKKAEKPVLIVEHPVPIQVNKSNTAPPKPNEVKLSEPIWSMKPPIIPTTNYNRQVPQKSQYSISQPSAPTVPRNMRYPPRGGQQYIYVPIHVYPPTFRYPQIPLNNNYGYTFSGNRFAPQTGPNRHTLPIKQLDLRNLDTIEKSK